MFYESAPLKGEPDKNVNGYNLTGIGSNDSEEEITPEQQDLIDDRLQSFIDENTEKKNENVLFYYILTSEERKDFERNLMYSKFNSYTFYNVLGKGYLDILRARLDSLLKEVRTADNTKFLQDLTPFDKYYYAILKDMGEDEETIADILFDTSKPSENIDQLVLQNTLEGYAARTEAGNYFTGTVTTGVKTNEVGWIGEYIFATEVYPKKYGNGNELPINTDKYIYRQTGYFGKWDFSDSTYSFEVKTQNMEKENPDAKYYCQISKINNIPANVSKIALWWGKSPSPDKTIKDRTIKEWRYIEMDKNDIGPGKKYHFEKNGFYDDTVRIATYSQQAGHSYSATPDEDQIVFTNDTYLQKYSI